MNLFSDLSHCKFKMTTKKSDSRTSASSLHSVSTDSRSRSSMTDLTNPFEPNSPYRGTWEKARNSLLCSPTPHYEQDEFEDGEKSIDVDGYTTQALTREMGTETVSYPVHFTPNLPTERNQHYEEAPILESLTISILDLDLLVQALVHAPMVQRHVRRQWYDEQDEDDCPDYGASTSNVPDLCASPLPRDRLSIRERRRSSAGILPDEDPSVIIHNTHHHHTQNVTCSRPPLSSLIIADPRVSGSPIRYTIPPPNGQSHQPNNNLLGHCSFASVPYGASTAGTLHITPSSRIKQQQQQHSADSKNNPKTTRQAISKVTYQITSQILSRKSHKKKFLLSAETDVTRSFIRAAIAELAEHNGLHPEDISISSSSPILSYRKSQHWTAEMKRHFQHSLTPHTASMQMLTLLSTLARLERQHAEFYLLKPSSGRRVHQNGTPESVRVPFISQGLVVGKVLPSSAKLSDRRHSRSRSRPVSSVGKNGEEEKRKDYVDDDDDESDDDKDKDKDGVCDYRDKIEKHGNGDTHLDLSDISDEDDDYEENFGDHPKQPRRKTNHSISKRQNHQYHHRRRRRRRNYHSEEAENEDGEGESNVDEDEHDNEDFNHFEVKQIHGGDLSNGRSRKNTVPQNENEIEDEEEQEEEEKAKHSNDDDDRAARFFREELVTLVSKHGYYHHHHHHYDDPTDSSSSSLSSNSDTDSDTDTDDNDDDENNDVYHRHSSPIPGKNTTTATTTRRRRRRRRKEGEKETGVKKPLALSVSLRDFGADVEFPGQGMKSVRFVPLIGSGSGRSSSKTTSKKFSRKKDQGHDQDHTKNKKDGNTDNNKEREDDVIWVCFVRERCDAMIGCSSND